MIKNLRRLAHTLPRSFRPVASLPQAGRTGASRPARAFASLRPGGPPLDEHASAAVRDMPVEHFAAAIEVDPPPMSFDEALAWAGASRGN